MSELPFKPHAIILTERSTPSPIWVAGIIGVAKLKRIDLDQSQPELTFLEQAMAGLRARLERWKVSGNGSGQLPAFGRPTGLCINYEPNRATRFDLQGDVVAILPKAMELGTAMTKTARGTVTLGTR